MNPALNEIAYIRKPLMRLNVISCSIVFACFLMTVSWFYVLFLDRQQSHAFISLETFTRALSFLQDLAGIDSSGTPAFMDLSKWQASGRMAYETLVMSVLAIGLAAIASVLTFIFAARNFMWGSLSPHSTWLSKGVFLFIRFIFTVTRAIPELVWAMLIVFILSPGILPGAIALAIHNWGILGKLSAEIVEGLDPRPAASLQAGGASRVKILFYGILPQALPRFLTYLFYRWEVIIRTTIVVGFVAAGGLGMEFRLSMSYFHYTTVTMLLIWYLGLVIFVDLLSAMMRRLIS
jgi:phosphonate transport system permease protein